MGMEGVRSTFTGGVKGSEEIDEECNETQMCRAVFRDVEAETCGEQCPGHVRECELSSVVSTRVGTRSVL